MIQKNLRNSFPEWDEAEIKKVTRRFYRQFCDSMVESVAFNFLNEKESLKRFRYKNPELVNELHAKGKSIVLLMAHYGNWELTSTCPKYVKHDVVAIYKPLTNKHFDRLFLNARQRFGLTAVPMDKILRFLVEADRQGKRTMTYFLADQRPHWSQIPYWTKFFNQDTPFFMGPEKIAKKFNSAVLYLKVTPIRRGYFESEFILVKEDSVNTKEHEITELYIQILENHIREAPEYWLWTHKRWKYVKKVEK